MKIKAERSADLEFEFPDDIKLNTLDKNVKKVPRHMKLVDFVIESDSYTYMIEVKDPSHAKAPAKNREEFVNKLLKKQLISHELLPKARGSYTFLHLMKQSSKPYKYIVLLGTDALGLPDEKNLLTSFKDKLFASIKKETDVEWALEYIQNCAVVNLEIWNETFPEWSVKRISQATPPPHIL